MPGTQENRCMLAAQAASMAAHHKTNEEIIASDPDAYHVWVGETEFVSKKGDSLRLYNKYGKGYHKGGGSSVVHGVWAGQTWAAEKLALEYPDVFTAKPPASGTFYLNVECMPGLTSASEAKSLPLDATPVVNQLLDVYEYKHGEELISLPLDESVRNPDGSKVFLKCYYGAVPGCYASFVLLPGILVGFRYPVEFRQDWLRIQVFLVSKSMATLTSG